MHVVAAGRIDAGEYELNYLAQAYWHCFQYRFGEVVGIVRVAKEVKLADAFDEEGQPITQARTIAYDTLVIAIGSATHSAVIGSVNRATSTGGIAPRIGPMYGTSSITP